MQQALETKRVSDICKYYNDIISERYTEDDTITAEILKHYRYVTESINLNDENEMNVVILFDESVYTYFNDNKFKENVRLELTKLDKEIGLVECMINAYQDYQNDPTRVTTTKWI